MPAMPQKAAGWRMEPPVSVAVAPSASRAATAAAEPPEEPPGTSTLSSPVALPGVLDAAEGRGGVGRAHGELVQVRLAQEHRAVPQQVGRHGALIGRHELPRILLAAVVRVPAVQNRSLMASGMPVSGPASPFGQRGVGRLGLLQRPQGSR
jgi:hypothetical protein